MASFYLFRMTTTGYFWKKNPFIKLLLPFAAGILWQWYTPISRELLWILLPAAAVALVLFSFIPLFNRFRYSFSAGICSSILFFSLGALLTRQHDIRNDGGWVGHSYREPDGILVTLEEPPVEKPRSRKVNARVQYILRGKVSLPVKGRIIIYFKKDSALQPDYGRQLLFKKPLQEIRNAGNPGGFDYKRYCLFQGITHQVYLEPGDVVWLGEKKENGFRRFLFAAREKVRGILQRYIKEEKVRGLAEALLIGYKNDLDDALVQAYARTGVVHIIAISGLHLGLIYWLLAVLLRPLKKNRSLRWLRPVLIISGLWLFSLLAGAQPSILRSAVMFTCMVMGESLSRKSSVYNTLALSAFVLLCLNPFWLWDAGFQLSYAAVLSIILFMQPVYNWFFINNKLLDFIWKLNAVTIAAQLLTLPVSVYHFQQFPALFLLSNFLAVPLSSIILLGEILLCAISFIPALAAAFAAGLSGLITFMNNYIERIDQIPFSRWEGLSISLPQAVFLYLTIAGMACWLMTRAARGLQWGLVALLGFVTLRSLSFLKHDRQQKIIVYHVPQQQAMDLLDGRKYVFLGDSSLQTDPKSRQFHLEPSRTGQRVRESRQLPGLYRRDHFISWSGRKILLLDETRPYYAAATGPVIDLLLISGNPQLYMKKLAAGLQFRKVVFDGSVPAWRTRYWKKDLDSLRIPWHDVGTQGAFVMNLN